MKRLLIFIGALVLGAVAGWPSGERIADAAASGEIFDGRTLIYHGSWRSSPSLGSADGDPMLIAWIARTGILPLARTEVAYFFTEVDVAGARLDPDCVYRVDVPDTDARWWSLTVYDEERKPIANALDRYSFNSDSGMNAIALARAEPASSAVGWLPLGEAVSIELLFRVYQPASDFDPDADGALPRVERSGPC